MELRYGKVKSFVIKRRTFEGKNDHSLTSKYMTSYKYWYELITEEGARHENTTRTKREAVGEIEDYKRKEGRLM